MFTHYESNNREMTLNVTILCSGNKRFRVWAEEINKRNSKYADREVNVEKSRTIFLSFPVSPKNLFIGVVNSANPYDQDFEVKIDEVPLKKYDIWIDDETKRFYQMAVNFSQVCGFQIPSDKGQVYQSNDAKYNIKYYPVIKDFVSGKVLSTPARVGHNTGIIEVSAFRFKNYTIPMRTCILGHEFSHKFKNPEIGLQIGNESGADINALYVYLGLGFSKIDAICVFANVFLKANTEKNIIRMRKIIEYIDNFENQQYAQLQ